MGQDLRTMVAVVEEIARECASTALCYLVHLAGAAAYAAAEPPMEDLLLATGKGKHLSSLALGEFGSRSHFWVPMSQIEHQNGKIIINASKAFVTSAGHADGYVLITGSHGAEAPTDTTMYYVPAHDPGIRVSGTWDALGMRGNASAPIVFKNVEIPLDHTLSCPGEGMAMLLNTVLPIVNLGVAAICIGIAEAATEITKQHILRSKLQHMSITLADLPNERARLARMRLETDKARAHLAAVLDSVERSASDAMLMILESKAAAADTVLLVTDIAMRAAGGTAFNRRLGLERRFRDARAADVLGITSDMFLEFIGRSLCGMPVP
jgi:alkylation response protein AidB-like acyl-CoA dehydrogenase